jgi:hypothetical protein
MRRFNELNLAIEQVESAAHQILFIPDHDI